MQPALILCACVCLPCTVLEVGNPPGGTGEQKGFENPHSWRSHFGAWAIVSSPLILSFDLTNKSKMGLVWDFCLFCRPQR